MRTWYLVDLGSRRSRRGARGQATAGVLTASLIRAAHDVHCLWSQAREALRLLPHLWKSTLASGILSLDHRRPESLAWPNIHSRCCHGVRCLPLIAGIAQVAFAFNLHVSAGGRILLFISGAASLILAVLAFRHFGAVSVTGHLDRHQVHLPRRRRWFRRLASDAAGTGMVHLRPA